MTNPPKTYEERLDQLDKRYVEFEKRHARIEAEHLNNMAKWRRKYVLFQTVNVVAMVVSSGALIYFIARIARIARIHCGQ